MLEAMQERRITVLGRSFELPEPFFVLATQNPVEQEGTYPLPEAQLDRFLMHIRIDYPDAEAERAILALARAESRHPPASPSSPVSQSAIFEARRRVLDLHMAERLEEYIVHLVLATRRPGAYGAEIADWVQYGASPRATITLDRCARAHAWLAGKDYVGPEDVQAVAYDALRHRIILNYEAEAEGITTDRVVEELLARVAVP
jgi:MoxR-like ATPase